MKFIINTDGASRGNPGPASYGFIIKSASGTILHQEGKTIGVATNNVAEYTAVLSALSYIKTYFPNTAHTLEVITDSKLIASQLSGRYKIKNANLKKIFDQIKKIEGALGQIIYRNVPRAQNHIADRLANQALDGKKI